MNIEPGGGTTLLPLLRLLQLASPSLPVGAYAYSQGLESAINEGWVTDAATTKEWCGDLLAFGHSYWDVPIFIRLHASWRLSDHGAVCHWSELLLAGRETSELQQEEYNLGKALLRVMEPLGLTAAIGTLMPPRPPFLALFAAAAHQFGIAARPACSAYLWAWAESQVMAATKLIPLGQNAAQKILFELAIDIESAVRAGAHLTDDELGMSAPGLAIASALHETQYTRLFRS